MKIIKIIRRYRRCTFGFIILIFLFLLFSQSPNQFLIENDISHNGKEKTATGTTTSSTVSLFQNDNDKENTASVSTTSSPVPVLDNHHNGKQNATAMSRISYPVAHDKNQDNMTIATTTWSPVPPLYNGNGKENISNVTTTSDNGTDNRTAVTTLPSSVPLFHKDINDTTKENTTAATATTSLLPLCSIEQIKSGLWKPIQLEKPYYLPFPYSKWRENECHTFEEMAHATSWDTYYWEPYAVSNGRCHFMTGFDVTKFCEMAKNTTIAFIGDSLTLEHVNSLARMLGFEGNTDAVWDKGNANTNFHFNVCNNETILLYRRTFWLEVVNVVLDEYTPNIIIMNTGSWYNPDYRFLRAIDKRIGAVQSWHERCLNQTLDYCQFIWRTTVPGHPYCSNYTKPSTSIEEMEELIKSESFYEEVGGENFHWMDFKHQNGLALDLLNRKLGFEYDVIPAYDINILRPDDHWTTKKVNGGFPDCLHSCPDSKIVIYNQVLLHLMELHKQKQQQQRQL